MTKYILGFILLFLVSGSVYAGQLVQVEGKVLKVKNGVGLIASSRSKEKVKLVLAKLSKDQRVYVNSNAGSRKTVLLKVPLKAFSH